MVFVVCLLIMCIGAVLYWIKKDDMWHPMHDLGKIIGWIGFAFVFVSLLVMVLFHSDTERYIAKHEVIYDSLKYQYENDIYEYEITKKELIERIEEWNKDLAYYQKEQDGFWLGVYIPNIFDELDYIELDKGAVE